MGRLLLFLLFSILSYLSIKKNLAPPRPKDGQGGPDKEKKKGLDPHEADETFKDPVCGTYVEKGSSLHLVHEGKPLYFCSEECRDKFLKSR